MKKTLIILSIAIIAVLIAIGLWYWLRPITPKVIYEEIKIEEEPLTYIHLLPDQAKELVDTTPDLIIIDVSPNYDKGHLPKAVNYYIGDGSLDNAIPNLDKEKIYLVYCHTDSASMEGAQKLADAGFKNVYRLEGNYKAWVDAGYPIE